VRRGRRRLDFGQHQPGSGADRTGRIGGQFAGAYADHPDPHHRYHDLAFRRRRARVVG
jgi:hypothetical protein